MAGTIHDCTRRLMISLDELYKIFPSNQACLTYIFEKKYKGTVCPKCLRSDSYHFARLTKSFMCTCGMHSIYPRKGTLFESSGTDLTKWFLAIYLFAHEANGISAMELKRKTGTDYHTASTIRRKIMEMILQHMEKKVERGHFLRFMSKINKKNRHVPPGQERLYAAEYLYRELDNSPDPFYALLDIALRLPSSPLPWCLWMMCTANFPITRRV